MNKKKQTNRNTTTKNTKKRLRVARKCDREINYEAKKRKNMGLDQLQNKKY